jgi:hypothetical protein
MRSRTLFASTALATSLLLGGVLPAAANVTIPIAGGYTGPVQLNFSNYESFMTPSGALSTTPAVGDTNFGIFSVFSITTTTSLKLPLFTAGENGDVLVGVFGGIKVTSLTGSGANVKTKNTGGVFDLYLVPVSEYLGAGGDQGTAGYTNAAGCTIGSLCYNGITNTAQGNQVLTLTLVPGVDGPVTTLTADVNTIDNPPTGGANFDGVVSGDPQFSPSVTGKDSFCPNTTASGCPGADNSSFPLASQDPIVGTIVPAPEPASTAILGSALISLGVFKSRRRKNKDRRG